MESNKVETLPYKETTTKKSENESRTDALAGNGVAVGDACGMGSGQLLIMTSVGTKSRFRGKNTFSDLLSQCLSHLL